MDSIQRYLELVRQYPSHFSQSELLPLILDEEKLRTFSKTSGLPLGLIYESPYHIFIVDLIRAKSGDNYRYARLLNPNPTSGVVLIPFYEQKIVLLEQFRHGSRSLEYELPRGFSTPNLCPEENAKKELMEELGSLVTDIRYEGSILCDSSLSGSPADIFSMDITAPTRFEEEEGIKNGLFLTMEEVRQMIRSNQIRDSFTISALAKYIINHT